MLLGGAFALGFAVFLGAVMIAKGKLGVDLGATMVAAVPAVFGLLALAASAHQFPRWRALWEKRLEVIINRALERADREE